MTIQWSWPIKVSVVLYGSFCFLSITEDIVYQYKLAKMEYDETKGHNFMVVHSRGTIAHNQSREIEIDGGSCVLCSCLKTCISKHF